jgi:tetratricopeptide (TPR) repeat protein
VDFDSDVRSESLGRWLVETGRISEEQYLASLDTMVSGHLSAGAAFVASGALEPGEELYGTLRSHVRAMVSRCMGLRDGRWRFHPGLEFTSEVQALEIPPLAPILQGARAHLPVRHFADALGSVRRAYPARTAEFPQLLPAMSLDTADLRVVLDVDGRTTVRAFLESRLRELKETYALLWFLSLVGAVAFHPTPAQAGDAFHYREASPPRKRPLPEDRAEALRQAALQILPGSYFKALGLDITAGVNEVERAYHEAASRFHPDGFAEFDLGGLEDLLAQVQDKVSAAYRVLSVDEKRKAYLTYLLARHAGETGRRRPDVDAEAEIAFKRGELALRQRHFARAAEAFREASERCPKEPEYLAMLAFALLRDPAVDRQSRPRASARAARRALALDPECVRALISLALAEEALGDTTDARRHLLAALKIAPDNLVAKRALQKLNRVRQ